MSSYLQDIFDRSGSTSSLINYRANLRRFFSDPNKLPTDYSRADVLAFINGPCYGKRNHGKAAAASTKNFRQAILTSFYTFASEYEVNGAPLYQKALPTVGMRYRQRAIEYRALSPQELEKFFSSIPDTVQGIRDRALFWTYFVTTRRRAEIAHLKWGDIEPASIDGRDSYIYRYHAKGHAHQVTTMEFPGSAYAAIERYLVVSGRRATIKAGDPLFTATPGRGRKADAKPAPMNLCHINWLFKKYAAKAGLDTKRLSLHSLRHAAIQERLRSGEPMLDIMKVSGHQSLDSFYHYAVGLIGQADPGALAIEQKYAHLSKM